MSQSQAKATRRGIRRALGEHGLQAVNAMTGLGVKTHTLESTVAAHTAALAQHNHELDSHDRQLAALHERLDRLECDARALQGMRFPQRLRWAMQALF